MWNDGTLFFLNKFFTKLTLFILPCNGSIIVTHPKWVSKCLKVNLVSISFMKNVNMTHLKQKLIDILWKPLIV